MAEAIRSVIEAYAHSHDPKYFAEDAVFTQMAMPQPFTGREAIAGMLRLFYEDAFSTLKASAAGRGDGDGASLRESHIPGAHRALAGIHPPADFECRARLL